MQLMEAYAACMACPVRSNSFCDAVPMSDLDSLGKARRLIRFNRRQTIVCEGTPATALFSIVSGVVKLYRSLADGRTQITGFRFPGEFFAAPHSGRYTTTVEALTSVEACCFPRSRLNRLSQRFPEIQANLIEMNHQHLAAAENQIFLLGRKTAREKVASFLLWYREKLDQEKMSQDRRMSLPMTRTEVADFLGLTTETVSRVLTGLAREKMLAIDKSHSITLLDVASLRRASGL